MQQPQWLAPQPLPGTDGGGEGKAGEGRAGEGE